MKYVSVGVIFFCPCEPGKDVSPKDPKNYEVKPRKTYYKLSVLHHSYILRMLIRWWRACKYENNPHSTLFSVTLVIIQYSSEQA